MARPPEIYAQAFNKDKDFYAFYRRMEAYKQAFGAGGSTMILSPDTDFFRYFNDPAGTAGGQEVAPENRRKNRTDGGVVAVLQRRRSNFANPWKS